MPLSDTVKRLWRVQAYKLIRFFTDFAAGGCRTNRNSRDDSYRARLTEGCNRNTHGPTGSQTVIDNNDCFPFYTWRRFTLAVERVASFQLGLFPGYDAINGVPLFSVQ